MNPTLTVEQLRNHFETLAGQYASLFEMKTKLEEECKSLRDYIEKQVSQIRSLNTEFDKLKEDLQVRRSMPVHQAPLNPDSSRAAQAPAAAPVEETVEQDWEVTTLVPPEQIEHPMVINLVAEIVDVSIICATAFNADGSCVAIGSDKTLRIYDIETNGFVFQDNIEEGDDQAANHIRSIVWTKDSQTLICGGEDGKVRVFSLPEKKCTRVFPVGSGEVFQVAISESNEFLAVVNGDGGLSIIRNEYTIIEYMQREEQAAATTVAISPDEKIVAVGYNDSVITLWDVETCQPILTKTCHDNGVYAVLFLPEKDGKQRLVSASLDNTVKIWELLNEEGTLNLKEVKVLTGHSSFVVSLAVDPTYEWLLSGSKDLTARLSSISSGVMVYRVKAHTNSVITVAFSPKGNMFCTGSGDQSVKIWSMVPEDAEETQ